jgi:hypothetical protein
MSTTSITQRPIPRAGIAAAVVAAVAVGGLTLAQNLSHDGTPSAPAQSQQQQAPQGPHHHFVTSSGGKVMLGE